MYEKITSQRTELLLCLVNNPQIIFHVLKDMTIMKALGGHEYCSGVWVKKSGFESLIELFSVTYKWNIQYATNAP